MLSKVLCDCGQPQRAAIILEQIIPTVIRTLGEDHVGMSMTKSNLARAYGLCKRWSEAEVLLRSLTSAVPEDHPDYIHAKHGYVHVLAKTGQLEKVEEICNKLLDMIARTGVLSMEHPRTVAIGELLAAVYKGQSRSEDIASLKMKIPLKNEDNDMDRNPFAMQ